MQQSERKAGMIFLWIAIFLVLFLLTLNYIGRREPRVNLQKENQAQQELVTRVFSNAPLIGAQEGSITLIEFGDFQCPFCKDTAPIIKEVRNLYPTQIRHIWINTFNASHEHSQSSAIASFCAHEQGRFWEYHDLLFDNQQNLGPSLYNQIAQNLQLDLEQFQTCLGSTYAKTAIQEQYQFANLVEVDATPYLLVNDEVLSGSFTAEQLKALIDTQI